MEILYTKQEIKLKATQTGQIRDFISQINWTNRLIGIKGARGAGKTTLLLQYIKTTLPHDQRTLYVSLDDLYFTANRLTDLADHFVKRGGEHLFLDEVHRYPGWSGELKNIYDDHPELKIIFTGSSIIDLKKAEADLSRRAVLYELPGLSFREYINFKCGTKIQPVPLDQLVVKHLEITRELVKQFMPIREFQGYLQHGYYPYFLEGEKEYPGKLASTINLAIETDIPSFIDLPFSNIVKIKQLLYLISQSVPFRPNIQRLSVKTGIARNTIIHYLHLLEEARLVNLLYTDIHGVGSLQKPEKIYLHHPNLMHALSGGTVESGSIRETFLLNQLLPKHQVTYPLHGDFLVDRKYTLEVGGKDKKQKQIVEIPDSFIVADNIEYGFERKVPLWLFGFLY